MMTRKPVYALLAVALVAVIANASVGATENASRTTYFTFSRAVQLPGVTLPRGTYIFEIVNPYTDSNVVRVMSRDRTKLFALKLTLPVYRQPATHMKSAIQLGEAPSGNPPVVRSWFPEGETRGRAFIY
jgi:hypothetical protein